jgi:phosphoenolpyruvate carboxykinase (ATP)
MEEHGSTAWLVNTGWIKGKYGVGERISLKATRAIIDAILDGSLLETEYKTMDIFGLQIPKAVNGVDPTLLNPRDQWADKAEYDSVAKNLAAKFIKNFENYTNNEEGKALVQHGPKV